MITRRRLLVSASVGIPGFARAQALDHFDMLMRRLQSEPELAISARKSREGLEFFDLTSGKKSGRPRIAPATRDISPRAIDLIIFSEITSEKYYRAKYVHPVLPGGASGLTIGVGYDLAFVDKDQLRLDWSSLLTTADLELLGAACRKHGEKAKTHLQECRSVTVPWEQAHRQFTGVLLPLYVALTLQALPRAQELSDNSLGALVSLTYNRGASYGSDGVRYQQMREIAAHIAAGRFEKIPSEIRDMKYIWAHKPDMAGLLLRREMEASLYEAGLN